MEEQRKKNPEPKAAERGAKEAATAKKAEAAGRANTPNQDIDNALNALTKDANMILEAFMEAVNLYSQLTPKERERLTGAGVRNYGFIEKVRDIARDNPSYLPPNFDVEQFSADLETFDKVRQFYFASEKMQSIASDKMLLMSSDLYREALRVYNTLKEQTKARVAGARDLFNAIEMFFKRKRGAERPPTETEQFRKAKGLIKGTVDGEMLLKNEKAKKTGGVHEVIEDIHKDQLSGKETAEFTN
jgi:hypothetical protein